MNPTRFVEELSALKFENTFNPYSSQCDVGDLNEAPRLRCGALCSILEMAMKFEIDSMWIGRDLGYRGGRRTGLAFTDDAHIEAHAARWNVKIDRSTRGQVVIEHTATYIWKVLSRIDVPVFLWNVFPLHPHEFGNPFSNRPHNYYERRFGEEFLSSLISMLRPNRLVAIGNDAARSARRLSDRHKVVQVRHPSYGGQGIFLSAMCKTYGLSLSRVYDAEGRTNSLLNSA